MSDNEASSNGKTLVKKMSTDAHRRAGHRSYVTKVIKSVQDIINDGNQEQFKNKLLSYKAGLERKVPVLKDFDERILDNCTGDDVGKEIVKAAEIQDEIEEILLEIATTLNISPNVMTTGLSVGENSRIKDDPDGERSVFGSTRLPKYELPNFSGNPLEWPSFWDSFRASVDGKNIDNVTKFNYLKGVLTGPAQSAISGLTLTSENYAEAIDILTKRFGNKQLIISSHMEKLLSIPAVTSVNDVGKIRSMHDEIENHVRNLKSLKIDAQQYGPVLISIVMTKLPVEVKLVVSRVMPVNEEWDVGELLRVLHREVESREMCSLMSATFTEKPNTRRYDKGRDVEFTAASLVTEAKQASQLYDGRLRQDYPHDGEHERVKNEFKRTDYRRQNRSRRHYGGDQDNKAGNRQQRVEGYLCVFCNRDHFASRCNVVTDIKARKSILKNKGRCFVCMKSNHMARECKSTYRCVKCNQRHHVTICEPRPPPPPEQQQHPQEHSGNQGISNHASNLSVGFKHYDKPSATLLQTAQAIISDDQSTEKSGRIRVLIDDGAQKSFVTEEIVNDLQLTVVRKEKMIVNGFGNDEDKLEELDIVCPILWNTSKTEYRRIELYVVPLICGPISCQDVRFAKENFDHLRNLLLADDTDGTDGLKIDVLIGGNFYWKFVSGEIVKGVTEPVAVDTIFGWTLSGAMGNCREEHAATLPSQIMLTMQKSVEDENLHELVKSFWILEAIGITDDVTKGKDVLEDFERNIKFDGSNYVVRLPFKKVDFCISDNFKVARARLYSLLRHLRRKPGLLEKYDQIIKDQVKEGIVEDIPSEELVNVGNSYYMPHREIIREDKETTKIRMVYDPRSKIVGPSLNECLETGPCLLPTVFDILVRFRMYRYGLTSDIKSAFLSIRVAPEDRNFLRFLWVDDILKAHPEIVAKRLTSVVFGINSGPFLLCATLHHHMKQYEDINPQVILQFLSDLYMDDSISGAKDIASGYIFYLYSKILMKEGGFLLRKWTTNSVELQNRIDENEAALGEPKVVPETDVNVKSVLGLKWDVGKDALMFSFANLFDDDQEVGNISKRYVLKKIASVFDPLGVLGPSVINLKMMLQELCAMKASWDEPLDAEFVSKWRKCATKLRNFECIQLPRFYSDGINVDDNTRFELHAFADASNKAYAGVVYLRIINNVGIRVIFVAAKTRVAPLNAKTIPILELLACLILSRLVQTVMNTLKNINISNICCWTDSMDCFFWISGVDKIWKRFIQNRVIEIRKNVPDVKWQHCPGKLNPADIPSRGLEITPGSNREIWLHGPEFLSRNNIVLQDDDGNFRRSCDEYASISNVLMVATEPGDTSAGKVGELIEVGRFSSLNRLLLVTSYVLRFIYNCRNRDTIRCGEISAHEMDDSKTIWIKYVQNPIISNTDRFNDLKCSLGAFIDDMGVIRLKGRLEYAEMNCNTPVLLPKDNEFTNLLILKAHLDVMHSGMKGTLNQIRNEYWVINGRAQVKKALKECLVCKKVHCKPFDMLPTAPLPDFRVQLQHPFANTGVDYIGPLYVYPTPGKDLGCHKVHIVLFTCASTRAVHLDIVPDATSYEFTLCMKRFLSRRGIPKLLISDNAKCFMGPEVKGFLRSTGCNWKFILEKSPWWGGFWERLVQTVKRTLRKTLGKGTLRYGELLTAVSEVEGVMNARPLCYQYSDELDDVLTPSHLLHGRRTFCRRSNEVITGETCLTLNKRLGHLQTVIDHAKRRWQQEYLTELREYHRQKGRVPEKQAKVGEVVLIEDKKISRSKWRLGVITDLITSKDGYIRGCKVKVADRGRTNTIQRPINHLYYFEVSSSISTAAESANVKNNTPEVIAEQVAEVDSRSHSRIRRRAAVAGELKRKSQNS